MKSVIVSILVIALVSTNFATINNVRADDTNHPYLTEVTINQLTEQGRLDFTLGAVNNSSYDVKVTNLYGKVVYNKSLDRNVKAFSVNNLYPSVYTVTVSANSGTEVDTKTTKLDVRIKQKNADYKNKFSDLGKLNKDRVDSVRWLYKYAITIGSGGINTYKPQDTVNRGAMAQFMQKLSDCLQCQTSCKWRICRTFAKSKLRRKGGQTCRSKESRLRFTGLV
jgi:hypothetical protein